MKALFPHPLTDRELRWLRHIEIHGPQSSEYLLELVAPTHRCRDTGLRTLQKLRETGFLRLPPQQRQIAKADFHPYVYDLTRKSDLHLRGIENLDTVRPTGHWWHAFLTSSITSAVAIEAARRAFRYIPAHEILKRSGATLAVPFGRQKLIPDQLFAIDYGGKFRSFALEVDRGTEPYRSHAARKSVESMLTLYQAVQAKDAARKQYGLKSPLLLLLAFANPSRAAHCLDLISAMGRAFRSTVFVTHVPMGFPRIKDTITAVNTAWRSTDQNTLMILET